MRVPIHKTTRGLRFNITPLIDIVFLLIIFFLAATHFVRSETRESVNLPVAGEAEDDASEHPRRLVVTVTADGSLRVNARPTDMQNVENMILTGQADHGGGFEVRIRSDRAAPYQFVEPILLACARHGVTQVKFAVLRDER